LAETFFCKTFQRYLYIKLDLSFAYVTGDKLADTDTNETCVTSNRCAGFGGGRTISGCFFLQRQFVEQVVAADCNYSNLQLYWSFKLHLMCVRRQNWKRGGGSRNHPVFIIRLRRHSWTPVHSRGFPPILCCMTETR
jgi:hypothetical protein